MTGRIWNLSRMILLVIDSYYAPLEFYRKIAKTTALAIYIDDNNRINYPDGKQL